jgi:hypothetical protein
MGKLIKNGKTKPIDIRKAKLDRMTLEEQLERIKVMERGETLHPTRRREGK